MRGPLYILRRVVIKRWTSNESVRQSPNHSFLHEPRRKFTRVKLSHSN